MNKDNWKPYSSFPLHMAPLCFDMWVGNSILICMIGMTESFILPFSPHLRPLHPPEVNSTLAYDKGDRKLYSALSFTPAPSSHHMRITLRCLMIKNSRKLYSALCFTPVPLSTLYANNPVVSDDKRQQKTLFCPLFYACPPLHTIRE